MSYFQTDNFTIERLEEDKVNSLYDQGFVLTRKGKGELIQTRSVRINLENFTINSENRRILNKNTDLTLECKDLPLANYKWEIHSLGKHFYTKRFGDGTMSASKIREMFLNPQENNMNNVFVYKYKGTTTDNGIADGYALIYLNQVLIHYAYPFYNLDIPKESNLGMAMMIKAILFAQDEGKKYIYLGSIVEKKSLYKLQFNGLEWFNTDSKKWETDINSLKDLIHNTATE